MAKIGRPVTGVSPKVSARLPEPQWTWLVAWCAAHSIDSESEGLRRALQRVQEDELPPGDDPMPSSHATHGRPFHVSE
jgi:hypothetical protein